MPTTSPTVPASMMPKIIKNDADHEAAVREIERLWTAVPGTDDHDKLELLGKLVTAYEEERWPIEPPDPIETIKFRMECCGYRKSDLAYRVDADTH